MNDREDKLNTCLAHWRDIEPRPGFEDRVWRRIQSVEPSPVMRWLDAARGWTVLQPAYAQAAALVVCAAVGLSVMWASVEPASAGASADFHILRTGSIAGSYAQLTDTTRL